MLNQETKRNIDNARDVLVWKIPVPSQQIEQITIALIYKFTSDIDREDKELWGKGFFNWEFEKYSWQNVMDRKLWGQERLNLYSEWLDKLDTNPDLPQMFRDVFRNAYLPFKDPATLDIFLKEINKFTYWHSEDLWDAFEYLLSTAWSQWDAGQFRTPRHIIDFIVSVVQPQLTDTVLDPACGTAWFLISAYKYIMDQNWDKVPWDKLNISQKKELTQHFNWYDISPEMVKLSLVNMFLHKFGDPKIFEYDTLSREERRDDRFDCILANPPFMTPKWWIQPHNRFSIKASKSEVLFVDYMMEHLNANWKAWIVVPEWIMFQWATAYKKLRETMIKENYLRWVISLPSGVFQPYSWVKTSILLFDKELAKKTDKILFVKVENDGFSLWAQRKEIKENDLPESLQLLLQYKQDLISGNDIKVENSKKILLVDKKTILEQADIKFSMDLYMWWDIAENSNYEMVKFDKILDFSWKWKRPASFSDDNWIIDFVVSSLNMKKCNEADFEEEAICIGDWWSANIHYLNWKFSVSDHVYKLNNLDSSKVLLKYVYYVVSKNLSVIEKWFQWQGLKNVSKSFLQNLEIPLPPLEVQEKIVAELDGCQKIIDGAKMIVENYKPTIKIDPEWEMVKLGDCIELKSGQDLTQDCFNENSEWIPYITWASNFNNGDLIINRWTKYPKSIAVRWDILLTCKWTIWEMWILKDDKVHIARQVMWIRVVNWNTIFIKNFLVSKIHEIKAKAQWLIPWITREDILSLNINLPSIEIQNKIVDEIEKEEKLVENAKQLIEIFEKKIQDRIDEIWGK